MPRMLLKAKGDNDRIVQAYIEGSTESLEALRLEIQEAQRTETVRMIRVFGDGSSTRFWLASRIFEIGPIE